MKNLILILFLYQLCSSSAGPCGDISVSSCSVPPNTVVDIINLPDSQNAVSQCQTACALIQTCNFFRYDHQTSQCSLLTQNAYRDSCERYSGPGTPTLEQCFSGEAFEDLCDAFTNDECTVEGEVVLEEENLNDLKACEDLLVVLGAALGANVFEFDGANNNNCKLYKNVVKSCQTFSGPSTPKFSDCGTIPTTWIPTTFAPTTFAPSPPGPNLEYEFCSEGEQPLDILNAWVSPFPIVAEKGGSYDLSLTVVLKQTLPVNSRLQLKIYKTGIIDFPLPCLDSPSYHFGSCEYEIDHLLHLWSDVLCGDFFPSGQDCLLPLKPGVYEGKHTVRYLDEFPIDIPDITLAEGTWRIEAHTLLEDGTEFGCVSWSYQISVSAP